jgi:iron-sulfur cluster assembly accessory protein
MFKKLYSTFTKSPIYITTNAITKLNTIYNKTCNKYFLFSAKNGGCNGFSYDFKSINNNEYLELYNNKYKPIIITNKNIKVIIDPVSEMFLLGTTIDYIQQDYINNIFESKFIFIPDKNLINTCGCGISFTPITKKF